MKIQLSVLGVLLSVSFTASATLYQFGTLAGGSSIGAIPDNSTIGLSGSYVVSGENTSLSGMTLTFVLQGGYSGDLTGYLRLGDTTGSASYDLTSLIHGSSLTAGTPTTYTVVFNSSDFQNAFGTSNPNGDWTLYFADTVAGDQTTFNGWSLDIAPVPEPVNLALIAFGFLACGDAVRRWRNRARTE